VQPFALRIALAAALLALASGVRATSQSTRVRGRVDFLRWTRSGRHILTNLGVITLAGRTRAPASVKADAVPGVSYAGCDLDPEERYIVYGRFTGHVRGGREFVSGQDLVMRSFQTGRQTGLLGEGTREVYLSPAWEPGGSRIAFIVYPSLDAALTRAYDYGQLQVRTVRSGRIVGHPKVLLPKAITCREILWSPKGRRLLVDGSDNPWRNRINKPERPCIVDITTGDRTPVRLPGFQDYDSSQASWSPDGRSIVFSAERDTGLAGTALVRYSVVDGSVQTLLSRLVTSEEEVHSPSWSPDGKHIAYLREWWNSDRKDIVVLSLSSRRTRSIFSSERGIGKGTVLTWSPDSTRIAFLQRGDHDEVDLVLVRVKDAGLKRIRIRGPDRRRAP
jgi:WD40 repeat protein